MRSKGREAWLAHGGRYAALYAGWLRGTPITLDDGLIENRR